MNKIIELIRLEEDYDYGTFGIMKVNKKVFCVTLEPRDEENLIKMSSIPAQQYICIRYFSPKFQYETFKIENVPFRSDILFHPGNTIKDTLGCILLGKSFFGMQKDRGINNSGSTFKVFMSLMEGENKFHLTIKEDY